MNANDANARQLSETEGRISEFLYLHYNFDPKFLNSNFKQNVNDSFGM